MWPDRHGRLARALLLSGLVHLLGLWLWVLLPPQDTVRRIFRPAVPVAQRFPIERFKPRAAPQVSARQLERLRETSGPALVAAPADAETETDSAQVEAPAARLSEAERGKPIEFSGVEDTLARPVDAFVFEPVVKAPPPGVELDAERRRTSVIVTDPQDRRNLKVWWKLPARPRPGRLIYDIIDHLNRTLIRENRRGEAWIEFEAEFIRQGARLTPERMAGHPVIWTFLISFEAADLAEYAMDGGFVITDRLDAMERAFREIEPDRVSRRYLTQEHPIFHAFYDVNYVFHRVPVPPPCTQNVLPVEALLVGERVVAVATYQTYVPDFALFADRRLYYVRSAPCPSNLHLLNLFIFGLTQPGGYASRYVTGGQP